MKKYIINSLCGKLSSESKWNYVYGTYYYDTGTALISFFNIENSLIKLDEEKFSVDIDNTWCLTLHSYETYFNINKSNFEEVLIPFITPILIYDLDRFISFMKFNNGKVIIIKIDKILSNIGEGYACKWF